LGTLRGLFLPFPGAQAVPAPGASVKSPGVEVNDRAVRDSEGTAP